MRRTIPRYPVVLDIATTFRFRIRPGTTVGGVKTPTPFSTLPMVNFYLRSGDKDYEQKYAMTRDIDGYWSVVIPANVTAKWHHRSMYYAIRGTLASGDVIPVAEGPIRVNQVGGRS